jgi:hypothetical protein
LQDAAPATAELLCVALEAALLGAVEVALEELLELELPQPARPAIAIEIRTTLRTAGKESRSRSR